MCIRDRTRVGLEHDPVRLPRRLVLNAAGARLSVLARREMLDLAPGQVELDGRVGATLGPDRRVADDDLQRDSPGRRADVVGDVDADFDLVLGRDRAARMTLL